MATLERGTSFRTCPRFALDTSLWKRQIATAYLPNTTLN